MVVNNVELSDEANYLIMRKLGTTSVEELEDEVSLVVLAKELCGALRKYSSCRTEARVALRVVTVPEDRDYRIEYHCPDPFFPDNPDSYTYLCSMKREDLIRYLRVGRDNVFVGIESIIVSMVNLIANLNGHGVSPEVLDVVGENGKYAVACWENGVAKREFGKVTYFDDYGSLWKVVNEIVKAFKQYVSEEDVYLQDFDISLDLGKSVLSPEYWSLTYEFVSVEEIFQGGEGDMTTGIALCKDSDILELSSGEVPVEVEERLMYWFGRLLRGYKYLEKKVTNLKVCLSSAFELTYYIVD